MRVEPRPLTAPRRPSLCHASMRNDAGCAPVRLATARSTRSTRSQIAFLQLADEPRGRVARCRRRCRSCARERVNRFDEVRDRIDRRCRPDAVPEVEDVRAAAPALEDACAPPRRSSRDRRRARPGPGCLAARGPGSRRARRLEIGAPIDADGFGRNLRDRVHEMRCAEREEDARGAGVGERVHDAAVVAARRTRDTCRRSCSPAQLSNSWMTSAPAATCIRR